MQQLIGEPYGGTSSANVDADLIQSTYGDVARHGRSPMPWVAINMIQSIDGGISVDGVSGPLGSAADKAVFRTLRSSAPVILVGAQTVRAEIYRPAACPIAVVTSTGDFGPAQALRHDDLTLFVTTLDSPIRDVAGDQVIAVPAMEPDLLGDTSKLAIDLRAALIALASKGFSWVLCEGGPTLNGQLLELDLVDEICVSISPTAVGGSATRLAHGAHAVAHRFVLKSAIEHDSMLLLRYLRPPD